MHWNVRYLAVLLAFGMLTAGLGGCQTPVDPRPIPVAQNQEAALQHGWEFAAWGMTVAEVVAAGQGRLQPCAAGECDGSDGYSKTRYWMPYVFEKIDCIASFNFDRETGLLSEVRVSLKDEGDAKKLLQATRLKYGQPRSEPGIVGKMYRWQVGEGQLWAFSVGWSESEPERASLAYVSAATLKKSEPQ